MLRRREVRTASDQIKIMIDSDDDRRTGCEFAVPHCDEQLRDPCASEHTSAS